MPDLLFHDATVVTMNRERAVLDHTSVAVRDGRIVEVGAAAEMCARHGDAVVVDCARKALMPGMVDLHGYLGGSLVKSAGQNLGGGERRNMLEDLLFKIGRASCRERV